MSKNVPLSTIGLIMPSDFPVAHYESINQRARNHGGDSAVQEQFAGAWNAVAYRFDAVVEYQAALSASLDRSHHGVVGPERSRQERDLFGFFSNGFSVFESVSYGLFSLGALICTTEFPIATPDDQRRISPSSTIRRITNAFREDPVIQVTTSVTTDPAYVEWSEVRHVLTHRAAPGRNIFVDREMRPTEWKLKSIPLTAEMVAVRRSELSRLLTELLRGIDEFAISRV